MRSICFEDLEVLTEKMEYDHQALDINFNLFSYEGFEQKDYLWDETRYTSFIEPFKVAIEKSYGLDFFRKDVPGYPNKPKDQFSQGLLRVDLRNSTRSQRSNLNLSVTQISQILEILGSVGKPSVEEEPKAKPAG